MDLKLMTVLLVFCITFLGISTVTQALTCTSSDIINMSIDDGETLENYEAELTVLYRQGMNANFSDVHFFNITGGTLLESWINTSEMINSSHTTIWVKVPQNISNNRQYITINWSCDEENDNTPDHVFMLYDDFEDNSLNTTLWACTGTCIEDNGVLSVYGSSLAETTSALLRGNFSVNASVEYASDNRWSMPLSLCNVTGADVCTPDTSRVYTGDGAWGNEQWVFEGVSSSNVNLQPPNMLTTIRNESWCGFENGVQQHSRAATFIDEMYLGLGRRAHTTIWNYSLIIGRQYYPSFTYEFEEGTYGMTIMNITYEDPAYIGTSTTISAIGRLNYAGLDINTQTMEMNYNGTMHNLTATETTIDEFYAYTTFTTNVEIINDSSVDFFLNFSANSFNETRFAVLSANQTQTYTEAPAINITFNANINATVEVPSGGFLRNYENVGNITLNMSEIPPGVTFVHFNEGLQHIEFTRDESESFDYEAYILTDIDSNGIEKTFAVLDRQAGIQNAEILIFAPVNNEYLLVAGGITGIMGEKIIALSAANYYLVNVTHDNYETHSNAYYVTSSALLDTRLEIQMRAIEDTTEWIDAFSDCPTAIYAIPTYCTIYIASQLGLNNLTYIITVNNITTTTLSNITGLSSEYTAIMNANNIDYVIQVYENGFYVHTFRFAYENVSSRTYQIGQDFGVTEETMVWFFFIVMIIGGFVGFIANTMYKGMGVFAFGLTVSAFGTMVYVFYFAGFIIGLWAIFLIVRRVF